MDIFRKNLTRLELLNESKKINKPKNTKINIHRNTAFEPISQIITPFLAFSDIFAEFIFSPFDNALSLNWCKFNADLDIVYIDLFGLKNYDFLIQQIKKIQSQTNALILINDIECEKIELENGIFLSQFLNLNDMDNELLEVQASRLNPKATIKLAQILGLKIIPSFLKPRLKAIILDLDNTLYSGILGEENIKITSDFLALQAYLKKLKNSGILLAIASKNDYSDAKNLFLNNASFILKWEDFSSTQINWEAKNKNIIKIAKTLNIGLDSLLFIDDNIAEIENIKAMGIKTILSQNPRQSLEILELFPNLDFYKQTSEDSLRARDLKANEIRNSFNDLDDESYFNNLKIELMFSLNDKQNLARITQLLNKTNQFIANYLRPSENEVQNFMQNGGIISVAMRDKLADSGIIAIFIGKNKNGNLMLDEITISCRALGRRLEKIMLFKACEMLICALNIKNKQIEINYKIGARNEPFLTFLDSIKTAKQANTAIFTLEKINTNGLIIRSKT